LVTVIADLDLAFGTAGLDFNVDPAQGILEALSSKDRLDGVLIDRLLTKCSERLLLLASPGSVDRVIDIHAETLEIILDLLRSSTPVTVIDMPTTWAGWMKAAVQQTDTMVIVATPELASLRNTKSLVDNMKGMRPNDEPPLLVLNQMEMGKRPEIPAADFARSVGLEVTSIIPFDAQAFGQAVTNGQMLMEVAPKSKAAAALEDLAQRISGIPAEQGKSTKKSSSLVGSLLGKLLKKA
jgi:pilus assembly protein CpaE